MIILRVAMGRGWREETAKEINTTLVFAEPPTARLHEQSQEVHVTIYNTKDPESELGTPTDMSIREHSSVRGADPLV